MIVIAPQLMGGALAWCVPVICAGALLCLGLALTQPNVGNDAAPQLLWAAIAATVWTGVQLIPLGSSVVERIAPERASALRLLGTALGHPVPASATAITYDPGATQAELLKGCALLCAFIACYILARRGQARLLLTAVAGSGALMAVVALGHRAVDARSIFGLYHWQHASPRLPAPILNDNCLAGFLVLTAPIALALAASAPDSRERVAHYLSAFTIAATGLLTGSRAGTGAMIFGLVATVAFGRVRPRIRRDRWKQVSVTAAIVAGALAVAVVIGAEPLFKMLNSKDFSKVDLVRQAFRVSFEHPWLGVGRGGFSAAMTSTMSDAGRFVHAENFVATWCGEWGVPIAAGVIASVSVAIWRLALRRSEVRVGPAIALVAFAAQNLLDLGIELVGIAIVAAAILAIALGDLDSDAPSDPGRRLNLAVVGRFVAGASVLVLVAFAPGALADGDDAFERRLEAHRVTRARGNFRIELERGLKVHPFEPVLFMLAGREGADHSDPAALRWLNLVMLRAPNWSAPHAQAARLLLSLGRPQQAALEAREAARREPGMGASTACLVAKHDHDPELVMIAAAGAAPGEAAQRFFDRLFQCVEPALARAVDQRLLQRHSQISGPLLREHQRLVAEGNAGLGLRLLQDAVRQPKPDPAIQLAYVRALIEAKDFSAGQAQLRRAAANGAPKDAVARLVAELATERGDVDKMRAAIEDLRAESASSGHKLASAATLLARLEERLGNVGAAEAALDDAAMLQPGPTALRNLLAFALRHDKQAKAQRVRASLCALQPSGRDCARPKR